MRGEEFLRSGFSYLFIGDYKQAQIAFAQAIEANPDNAAYAFHGSVTAWRNGDKDQAQAWAWRALKLEPDNGLYQENYKMMQEQMKDTTDYESGPEDHYHSP